MMLHGTSSYMGVYVQHNGRALYDLWRCWCPRIPDSIIILVRRGIIDVLVDCDC